MRDQLKRELYLEFTPFEAEDEQDKLDYRMAQEVPQEAFLSLSTPRPQGNARFYVLYADSHRNYMWGDENSLLEVGTTRARSSVGIR